MACELLHVGEGVPPSATRLQQESGERHSRSSKVSCLTALSSCKFLPYPSQNLTHTVPSNTEKNTLAYLLQGVSGFLQPGEMTALVRPCARGAAGFAGRAARRSYTIPPSGFARERGSSVLQLVSVNTHDCSALRYPRSSPLSRALSGVTFSKSVAHCSQHPCTRAPLHPPTTDGSVRQRQDHPPGHPLRAENRGQNRGRHLLLRLHPVPRLPPPLHRVRSSFCCFSRE